MYYRADNDTSAAAYGTRESNIAGSALIGADQGGGVEVVATVSTSATPFIVPAGDEANKSLTVKAKGTGTLTLGDSSNVVQIGNVFTVQFTPAALAANAQSQSTITVTGLSTGRPVFGMVQSPTNLSGAYNFRFQCSTANELRLTQQNMTGSSIGSGESTGRFLLIQL
jgi:hypothetical protein